MKPTPLPNCRTVVVAATLFALAAATFARGDDEKSLLDEIDRTTATQPSSATAGTSAASPASSSSMTAEQSAETTAAPVEGLWGLARFFAPTLIVAASLGLSGAAVGTFVLRRGEALLALALPQSVAVGAALGMRLGWPELPPALAAVLLSLMVFARRPRATAATPTLVPSWYVGALCLSFLIVAHAGQHVEELQSLFTGIDVAVTPGQAAACGPPLILVGLAVALLWRRWLLLAQAPTSAELAGLSVAGWQTFFLGALAAYVLLGTATQGVVMTLAMLFMPATVVAPWCRRLPSAVAAAAAVAVLMLAVAFVLSNECAWPLSHSVGGVGCGLLLGSRLIAAPRRWIA